MPSIYFAHLRNVFLRDGMLMAVSEHLDPDEGASVFEARVRFRTVGDADCTGCVESPALTVEAIIQEVSVTRLTERGATRADDRISEVGWRTGSGRAISNDGASSSDYGGIGRRRQVHADRSTSVRLEGHLRGSARAIQRTSLRRGNTDTDLSLLTDGLRAEREQGITIDVAYRYFSTPKRKFIIADTPGHAEYTRNMVTGASNANLAIILVDARNGIVEQSRRHAFLSNLLGIPHMVVCVNKMDLVDWDAPL